MVVSLIKLLSNSGSIFNFFYRLVVNCSQHLQHIHIYTNNSVYKNERLHMLQQRAAGNFGSDIYLLNPDSRIYRKSRAAQDNITTSGQISASTPLSSSVTSSNQSEQASLPKSTAPLTNSPNTWNTVNIPIQEEIKDGLTSYSVVVRYFSSVV